MNQLLAGQRWISETEPELGLGMLIGVNDRTVSIRFDLSDCTRQYTLKSAPIKRVIFQPGDKIQLKDNTSFIVDSVSESGGLVYYFEAERGVCEKDLTDTISFSSPKDRLFAGITDNNKLFDLRYRLLKSKKKYDASLAKGFLGGQVDLIPHQFFIADTVTSRYIPRVLLSDETGLGKTIEACLILHKLLITGRVERILIIVPESLVHQWFIELYRKFNLSFMIFNEDYCSSIESPGISRNPFLEHQLGLVSIDFLKDKKRQAQVHEAGWDLLVVDEAHHITDDEKTHRFIQGLARNSFGLMLLTATPEQMGIKKHFLHLKLLDPERYFDFDTYLEETARYKDTLHTLKQLIKNKKDIDHVLDSYGPGRVIFRNKRKVIQGFPKRGVHLKGFTAPAYQINASNHDFFNDDEAFCHSFADDPRILYLIELVRQKKKLLILCSSKEKTAAIEKAVAKHISIDIARFDETMTLLQRDRNAAWFSKENGARLLICSEIGSEGRNFQFVHHLFLFDLPGNPELLEQRIGRLDRIGQKNDIQIHVPYIRKSVYEVLARWYMNGLNLFKKNINGVHLIHKKFEKDLKHLFRQSKETASFDEVFFKKLIFRTKTFCTQVDKQLAQGKNILLEMNSFKPGPAKKIIDTIIQLENSRELEDLMTRVLDHYGIETDFIDKTLFKLRQGNLTDEGFPGIASLSDTMTFNRSTAVVRDDVDFFSWDHPFVQQVFDYFLTTGTGSCATAIKDGQGKKGLLLEIIFILECVAPAHLNIERYLLSDPIRIVVDHEGNDQTRQNEFSAHSRHLSGDQKNGFMDLEGIRQDLIPSMIEKSISIAEDHSKILIKKGEARVKDLLDKEITRLLELKKINPGISEKEIQLARARKATLLDHLSCARPRIDALRLIRLK